MGILSTNPGLWSNEKTGQIIDAVDDSKYNGYKIVFIINIGNKFN